MVDIASIKKLQLERKEQLQNALEHLLDQLKELKVLKVVLFGSLNEDNIDINSDIDLLIIMPNSKSTKEWTNLIYENIERNVASDLVIYNLNDFEEMLPKSSFLQHIVDTGKILYEKT
jgi:predicted nucleotidyltransferase